MGSWRGRFGFYEVDDIFSIERSGNVIEYKKNGSTFYSSLKTTLNSLFADCSFSSNNAEINDATILGFTAGVPGQIHDLKSAIGNTSITLKWSPAANNMYALTEYVVEYGTVASSAFASSKVVNASNTSTVIDSLVNDTEYQFRIYARNSQGDSPLSNVTVNTPTDFDNVTWKDLENTTVSGNSLIKINTNGWDGGAYSTNSFSGNGFLEFETSQTNRYKMIGFSSTNKDSHYNTIEYAISLNSNGQYYVYENGSHRGTFGYYYIDDIFKIERNSQIIRYYRNGSLFYTSSIPTLKGLSTDAALYSIDGNILNAKMTYTKGAPGAVFNLTPSVSNTEIKLSWSKPANNGHALTEYVIEYGTVASGAFASSVPFAAPATTRTISGLTNNTEYQFRIYASNSQGDGPLSNTVTASPDNFDSVTWVDLVDVNATGNTITKDGTNEWNAGAASFTSFSGDGSLEFKVDAINRNRMCGLSSINRNEHYNTIEYAIYLTSGSRFYVYENGNSRGSFGIYGIDDVFSVERTGGAIRYKRNGTTFYISPTPTDKGLMADAAINTNEGTITDARLVGITKGAPGKIYDLVASVGDTEATLTWTPPANNSYVLTDYVIEYGTVASGAFGSSVTIASGVATTQITGLTNGVEYQFRIYTSNSQGDSLVSNVTTITPNSFIPVTWVDIVNASASGNSLLKNADNGWDSGGASFISFSGDGALEFTADATNKNVVCGLSSKNEDSDYTTIEYAVRLNSNGRVYVYEKGISRGLFEYYSVGDTFLIQRSGNIVQYKRNGDVFYTSRTLTDKGLMVDGSLYNDNSQIKNAKLLNITLGKPGKISDLSLIDAGTEATLNWSKPANNGHAITSYTIEYGLISSGIFNFSLSVNPDELTATITGLDNSEKYQFRMYAINSQGHSDYSNIVSSPSSAYSDVVWTDPQNVTVTSNSLQKSGANGWNAGARSFTSFSGNGGVVFTAGANDEILMCGLASKDVDYNYNRIDHAIYLYDTSYVYVYENGVYIGRYNTYQSGDSFSVEKVGSSILYKQNDQIFHTSFSDSSCLMVDSSINKDSGQIINARLKGVTKGVPGTINSLGAHSNGTEANLTWNTPANNGYDIIEYTIQYGTVASNAFASSVTFAAPVNNRTISGLTNNTEYQFRIFATNSQGNGDVSNIATINTYVFDDVIWTEDTGVNIAGNTLTSNTSGWGNSGATSFMRFSGDGKLEFQTVSNTTSRMAGLTSSNQDDHYNTIEFAIYLQSNGTYGVYEHGRSRGNFGTYNVDDWFSVERKGINVEYKINNSLFYKSLLTTEKGLQADVSFSSNNSDISQARWIGITKGAPGKVTDLSGSVGDNQATLLWTPPANNGYVLTQYVVEYGTVASGNFSSSLTVAAPASTVTIAGLTNNEKYQFRMYATNSQGDGEISSPIYITPNETYDITWIDPVNVTINGSSVTSNTYDWGNSGAASFTSFSGNGSFEFKVAQTDRNLMCGLTSSNLDEHYNTIEYAIYLRSNGEFNVYENGSNRGTFGEYNNQDSFIIERIGSIIRYKINGLVFYTSSITSNRGLMADCSFSSNDATINDAKFIGITKGPPGKIFTFNGSIGNNQVYLNWTAPANNGYAFIEYIIEYGTVASNSFASSVSVAGNITQANITGLTNLETYQFRIYARNSQGTGERSQAITITPDATYPVNWIDKVGVTDTATTLTSDEYGWDNAGAASFTSFSGNGSFEFQVPQTNRNFMCGLSNQNLNTHYNTINYAIYLRSNSELSIYENGSNRGNFGQYGNNDVFLIERDGSVINYKKNGITFYTSITDNFSPLMVDCSFSSRDAIINNPKFVGITKGPPGKVTDLTATVLDGGAKLEWIPPANNGYALTEYVVEYGTVASSAFDSTITFAAPASSCEINALNNLEKYQFRIYAKNSEGNAPYSNVATITPNSVTNINWIDRVNVVVSASDITSTDSGWGDSGAVSFTSFSGNGGFEFQATQTNRALMAGLSSQNRDAHYNTINYAFYLQSNSLLRVYERGSYKGDFGSYKIGDTFCVERVGTTILYKHNDNVVYSSAINYTGALMADVSFSSTNATLSNTKLVGVTPGPPGAIIDLVAKTSNNSVELMWTPPANNGFAIISYEIQYGPVYSGGFDMTLTDDAIAGAEITGLSSGVEYQFRVFANNSAGSGPLSNIATAKPAASSDINWTDKVLVEEGVLNSLNTIKRTSGSGWGGSGAASINSFLEYGGIDFTVGQTNRAFMVGLSETNADEHYNTIAYALYLEGNSRIRIYENGGYIIDCGYYSQEDRFAIERKKSTIYYKKNGNILYTSRVLNSNSLIADVSFSNEALLVDTKMFTTMAIQNFRATASQTENIITLNWDVPDPSLDPEFQGALIVFKEGGFPANSSDGVVLGNYPASQTEAVHINLQSEVTYYYAIFGYKAGPIYDHPLTAQAITSDQISPEQITNLSSTEGVESITFNWNNPDLSVYPNLDFEGILIRRSTSSYPLTAEEGTEIARLYGDVTTYTDNNLDPSQTYYYSFFSFDEVPLYSDPAHISDKPIYNIQRLVIIPAAVNSNYANTVIPNLTSGSPTPFKIAALSPDGDIVTTFNGPKTISFSSRYLTNSSGVQPDINSSILPLSLSLNFINGISSNFNLNYNDSGIISLNALFQANSSDGSFETEPSPSISFIPFSFYINAKTDNQTNHFIVGKPFEVNLNAVAMDNNNNDLSDNIITRSYQSSAVNLSMENINSSSQRVSTQNFISFTDGAATASLINNSLGFIKITAFDASYLGNSILGESQELEFTPNSFNMEITDPPAKRKFFYINEIINLKCFAADFNNILLNDYLGSVLFFNYSPEIIENLVPSYQFLVEDQGFHNFSFSANTEGIYTLSIKDQKYADIIGISPEFEIKYAKIVIESKTVLTDEFETINFKIVDKDGEIIDTDSSTKCEIEIKENNDNDSAVLKNEIITVSNGIGQFVIKNSESEIVTISIKSDPLLPVEEGIITFTDNKSEAIGQGGLRIVYWKEIKT